MNNMGVYFKEDDGKRSFKRRHMGSLMVMNDKATFINKNGAITEIQFNNIDRIELMGKMAIFFYLKNSRLYKCMPFADRSAHMRGSRAGMFLGGIQGANLGGMLAKERSRKNNATQLYNQLKYLLNEYQNKN